MSASTRTRLVAGTLSLCSLVAIIGGCWWNRTGSKSLDLGNLAEYEERSRHAIAAPGGEIERVVYLDQGWSPADSLDFYSRPQGSRLIPYSWFLALEQHDREELFRSSEHVARLGYLSQKPHDLNPDGLPVGFVKDPDSDRGDWLGLTCAACHTSEIHFGKKAMRIDGGPTLGDFQQLHTSLTKALQATLDDPAKFGRFCERLKVRDRDVFRAQLKMSCMSRSDYESLNATPHPYGNARLDAFGHILNQVIVRDLNNAASEGKSPDAPVSYPFLWDTPHHDFVQWNAIARNKILGNDRLGGLARNVGEVIGVFGEVHVAPLGTTTVFTGYRSSVRVPDLLHLEEQIRKLRSPEWPELLPPIDKEKAVAGRIIYDEHCVRCHAHIDHADPSRSIQAVKTPIRKVGTDPKMAENVADRSAKTGRVRGRREYFVAGDRFGEKAQADALVVHTVLGVVLNSPWKQYKEVSLEGVRDQNRKGDRESLLVYKARPLNGIWATAPYLHNGSVPSLYELLKPASERVSDFHVGSRVFDPVTVGYVITPSPNSFRFRTHGDDGKPIPGNSNAGHEYGTKLTDEQRWQLVEYLKTQ